MVLAAVTLAGCDPPTSPNRAPLVPPATQPATAQQAATPAPANPNLLPDSPEAALREFMLAVARRDSLAIRRLAVGRPGLGILWNSASGSGDSPQREVARIAEAKIRRVQPGEWVADNAAARTTRRVSLRETQEPQALLVMSGDTMPRRALHLDDGWIIDPADMIAARQRDVAHVSSGPTTKPSMSRVSAAAEAGNAAASPASALIRPSTRPVPATRPAPSGDTPATEWADFRGTSAGMSLKFPREWTPYEPAPGKAAWRMAFASPMDAQGSRVLFALEVLPLPDDLPAPSLEAFATRALTEARAVPTFTLESDDTTTFAGQPARRWTYQIDMQGQAARKLQVFCVAAGKVYTANFTARDSAAFARYMPVVQGMLQSIRVEALATPR